MKKTEFIRQIQKMDKGKKIDIAQASEYVANTLSLVKLLTGLDLDPVIRKIK